MRGGSNPDGRTAAPGLLTWGFSRQWLISVFHVVGFLMWRRRGLDGQRAPSSSWKPVFPAARGCQGAKLAGGDAHGAPLTAPSRRKSHEHEIEGAAGRQALARLRRPRGFQRFMSFASGCSNPSILGRASRAFWSIAGTISHSVVAFQRPHPDSAFAGGRLGRASPLFATAFQAQQSIGSPTRIDRG